MANRNRFKRRAAAGAAGAPTSLLSAEPAFNEADKTLYYGFGDDGSGNATSVIPIGGEGTFALRSYVDGKVAAAGGGDMLKSTYDSNNNGKVDNADSADTVIAKAITNAKMADIATATIKGRATAGTGAPEDLSVAQVLALLGVAAGAEVNQNAFTTVSVSGQSDVVADAKSDVLTLINGTNIQVTTNATSDAVTISTLATVNDTDANLRARSSHTGTQSADTIVDGTTNKVYTATEKTKLAGVAANADVTGAGNVGAAIAGSAAKANPVAADRITILDSEASNVLKTITYAALANAITAILSNSAPAALDTLSELATALGNDANFATTISTALGLKAPKADPTFTGAVVVPDLAAGNNTSQAANAKFVQTAIANAVIDGGTF